MASVPTSLWKSGTVICTAIWSIRHRDIDIAITVGNGLQTLAFALYRPHFGPAIAKEHPGVNAWDDLKKVVRLYRGNQRLKQHNLILDEIRTHYACRRRGPCSFLFLSTPRLIFNPPVKKANPMTPEQFQSLYPFVREWISQTLAANAAKAKPVAALNFPRLHRYYSSDLLTWAKVVFVDKCPTPQLSALGLNQFAEFENMKASGITYLDTYFVLSHEAERESLHFHELVHVIQWQVLGPERFVALYAEGLEKHGYRDSPLEVMAYDHEARFNSGGEPYAVEAVVCQQLRALL